MGTESVASDVALNAFNRSESLLPTQIDGNHIDHFILKSDATYSISSTFSLSGGIQTDRVSSGVEISDFTYLPTDVSQSSNLISGYLKSQHTFGQYWNIEWGSRLTYTDAAEQLFAEPRVAVQYDRPDSEIGYWSARVSGGLYRQYVNEYRVANSGPTSLVPTFSIWSHADDTSIPKAWHLSGSWLFEPNQQTTITASGFYKWQPITNITSYAQLSDSRPEVQAGRNEDEISAFAESTEMTVLGGGIRVKQRSVNSTINLIAGYDYTYSQLRLDSQFNQTLPSPWVDPHRLQLRTLWHLHSQLSISAKWQSRLGRSWAFRDSYYNFLRFREPENMLPVSFDSPENDRLPAFHQVDVSFIFRPSLGNADIELRAELINILNHNNTLDKHLEPVLNQDELEGPEFK